MNCLVRDYWKLSDFVSSMIQDLIPESCTKYRSEAPKALFLKRSWSDFDPQAYYLYGEDQNHETSFKNKALQAAVDSWCRIQVILQNLVNSP